MILFALTALLLTQTSTNPAAADAPPSQPRLLRFPTIHGNRLVFTYGGDLWTSQTPTGLARRLTASPGPDGYAYFSPDGKTLAFTGTYEGYPDIYVMPSEGGEPRRLTFDPEGDEVVGWTPAGKIAYITSHGSPISRQSRLMLIDPKGGMAEATPLQEVGDVSFSPDGNTVAYDRIPSYTFNWRRYRGGSQGVISLYNLATNTYSELPHGKENSWCPQWIGGTIYFMSDKTEGTVNLYSYDLVSKKTEQLTKFSDFDIKTMRTDGKSIVFERDGYLYDYDTTTREVKKLAPKVLSDDVPSRPTMKKLSPYISGFSLSPSGNRVAVEARGRIYTVPAQHGEIRPIAVSDTARASSPSWSPDGKTIAYLSDESGEQKIMVVPQMGSASGQKPVQIPTDPKDHIVGIDWMPDSEHMTYTTVDQRLMTLDLTTKKADLVVKADQDLGSYDYSPDSNWIAYVKAGANDFSALYLYNVRTKKTNKITEGYYRDDRVSFDLSGKYLYLVSSRTVNAIPGDFERGLNTYGAQRIYLVLLTKDERNPLLPESDEEPAGMNDSMPTVNPTHPPTSPPPSKPGQMPPSPGPRRGLPKTGGSMTPVAPPAPTPGAEEAIDESPTIKIDIDGLGDRIIPLPLPPGVYPMILGSTEGVFYSDGDSLDRFDLNSSENSTLIDGLRGQLSFNGARQKFAYFIAGQLGIVDAHPSIRPFEGRIDTSSLQAVIDPKKEWNEIYWEAWRWERDNFYDPKFTGVDWNAIGKKYADYLPSVSNRYDLNYVLGLMIGELGTSHAYVQGGDLGARSTPITVGQLGADYEVSHGKIRFKKIYRGLNFEEGHRGPLGEPGVNIKDGEYLLAIDGVEVKPNVDPGAYMLDKIGHTVMLTVNSAPTMEGSRQVSVRPLATETDLRYIDWVEANRKKVAEISGGEIGYMHIPDTDTEGIAAFVRGFYSQSDKKAVVVDERWNAGGDIPTFFTEKLSRRSELAFRGRYSRDSVVPEQAINGPKALLINGYAGSGGDLFAYLFRKNDLGPLVGSRTWGGLVGFSEVYPLIDGGVITAPQFGIYDPATGKWIAENHGIDPDVAVDERPDLVAKGRDPQLEKAVQILMDKLKAGTGKLPNKRPNYPDIRKPNNPGAATG